MVEVAGGPITIPLGSHSGGNASFLSRDENHLPLIGR